MAGDEEGHDAQQHQGDAAVAAAADGLLNGKKVLRYTSTRTVLHKKISQVGFLSLSPEYITSIIGHHEAVCHFLLEHPVLH